MNTRRLVAGLCQMQFWSGEWVRYRCRRRALLAKWLPTVGGLVVALALVGSTVVLAAGDGRAPRPLTQTSPLPTPTNTPVPSTGFNYTVQRGDTLYSIANRFGTTVQAIVQANGIVNPNLIFYGQVLWISGAGDCERAVLSVHHLRWAKARHPWHWHGAPVISEGVHRPGGRYAVGNRSALLNDALGYRGC